MIAVPLMLLGDTTNHVNRYLVIACWFPSRWYIESTRRLNLSSQRPPDVPNFRRHHDVEMLSFASLRHQFFAREGYTDIDQGFVKCKIPISPSSSKSEWLTAASRRRECSPIVRLKACPNITPDQTLHNSLA